MQDAPHTRIVLGMVTHQDGTQTWGLHVRNPQGQLVYVLLTEETMDGDRWHWACQAAQRLLAGPQGDPQP